jgi:citrate lyase subunit beta / citryl-CoA lyase
MDAFPGPALLFCPADRPERFAKAASLADGVIIDLEDSVATGDKPAARQHVLSSTLDPARTIIRVNPANTPDHALDLAMVRQTAYRLIMLAKAEHPDDVRRVSTELGGAGVIALCETAQGVVRAADIAAEAATIALMWGAEDLIVSLGGRSSRHEDARYRDVARHARSQVLLAAGASGKAAIDAVHLDIPDLAGLREEAEDAAASGFAATACIHPTQVSAVRAAYRPSPVELNAARALLAAAESQPGVFAFEGRMIDEPILRQARRLLAAAADLPEVPSN